MCLDNVVIEDIAVVFCHRQCGVPHEFLQHKRIAAAVYQILAGERMPERMERSALHPARPVIFGNGLPQRILCKHIAVFVAEQMILCAAAADRHIILKDRDHHPAQRNDLNPSVFRMPQRDLSSGQIYVLYLDTTHRSSAAAAV